MAAIFFADCRKTLQLEKGAMEQLGIRVTGSVLSGTMNVWEAQRQSREAAQVKALPHSREREGFLARAK